MIGILTLLAACSSGGDQAGFCRRWDKVLDNVSSGKIANTAELVAAVSRSRLGDPGGTLSSLRQSFEEAITSGTTEEATQLTQVISDYCAEIGS